jgi:hypothetical protein
MIATIKLTAIIHLMTIRFWLACFVSGILHLLLLGWFSMPLSGANAIHPVTLTQGRVLTLTISATRKDEEQKASPQSDKTSGWNEQSPGNQLRQTPNMPGASGVNIYWPTTLLDVPPEVINDIPIDPPELRDHPEGGNLVLAVRIGLDGRVDGVEAESSSLPTPFIDSLTRHFLAARFYPGMRDGHVVRTFMRVEIKVRPLPQSSGITPAVTTPLVDAQPSLIPMQEEH